MSTTVPTRNLRLLNPSMVRGRVHHCLFDFDGTLSLIREGWQSVMIPMMVQLLEQTKSGETADQLEAIVRDFVTRLTGKQTIYQMLELDRQIQQRGGAPIDPVACKHEYLRRLEERIAGRVQGLADGTIDPAELLVPGAREFLDGLRERGLRLYLASGTDEPFVLREAHLLGVDTFFDGGIFGAKDDYKQFSKKLVIDRIIAENELHGPELLGVGDGYVEIENTKAVGGVALGVATIESAPDDFDPWKTDRLTEAGADLLIPHFGDHEVLLDYLMDTQ